MTNVTVPHATVFRDTAKTSSVKVVECEQTNTGSHAAHPGTHGGALHGRYGAPTATDGSEANPRRGKGVNDTTGDDSRYSRTGYCYTGQAGIEILR